MIQSPLFKLVEHGADHVSRQSDTRGHAKSVVDRQRHTQHDDAWPQVEPILQQVWVTDFLLKHRAALHPLGCAAVVQVA